MAVSEKLKNKQNLKFGKERLISQSVLAFLSMFACYLASLYGPNFSSSEVLSVGLGYASLIFLVLTLTVGPINLLLQRRNPVNINLRRDLGIWAGITGVIHVYFSFNLFENGNWLGYFFNQDSTGFQPLLNRFGIGNYFGLVGTAILLVLLVTSNQVSLKFLKGKRWKTLQRFNYPLFGLAVLHTLVYQLYNLREGVFGLGLAGISAGVVLAQFGGVVITILRQRQRREKPELVRPPLGTVLLGPTSQLGPEQLARRRFLLITGALVLGSGGFGLALGRALTKNASSGTIAGAVTGQEASLTPVSPSPQVPLATVTPTRPDRTIPNNPNRGRNNFSNPSNPAPGARGNLPPQGTSGTQAGGLNSPNQGSFSRPGYGGAPNSSTPAGSAGRVPTGPTPTASTGSQSFVLANIAALPVGDAIRFQTPDGGENAFLIHAQDGSVKAFSGTCTHRPFQLVFNKIDQTLVCNLHNVPFSTSTGAPTRSPARSPLTAIGVKTDNSGNIIYIQG